MLADVDELRPACAVLDALSGTATAAETTIRYRRQLLAFKQFFVTRHCGALLDDCTVAAGDPHAERAAWRAAARACGSPMAAIVASCGSPKMRAGVPFGRARLHEIRRGGLVVFPRLVPGDEDATVRAPADVERHSWARCAARRRTRHRQQPAGDETGGYRRRRSRCGARAGRRRPGVAFAHLRRGSGVPWPSDSCGSAWILGRRWQRVGCSCARSIQWNSRPGNSASRAAGGGARRRDGGVVDSLNQLPERGVRRAPTGRAVARDVRIPGGARRPGHVLVAGQGAHTRTSRPASTSATCPTRSCSCATESRGHLCNAISVAKARQRAQSRPRASC